MFACLLLGVWVFSQKVECFLWSLVMRISYAWVWKEEIREKAGFSLGKELGNSQKDHLSVLTLFFFFLLLCVCLAAAGAAIAAPVEHDSSGAVPEPAPSHSFCLACGFLGNHPDQRKHSAPDGSY